MPRPRNRRRYGGRARPARRHKAGARRCSARGRRNIASACGQRRDEAFGVDGGLHHAGCHMRPGDEGGVAHERDAPEGDAGRFKIEDRLQDNLCRGVHQRGKLRREQCVGVVLERRDQLRAGSAAAGSRRHGGGRWRRCKGRRGRFPSPAGTRRSGRRACLRRAAPASGSTASVRRPESRTPSGETSGREDRATARPPRPRRARPHSRHSAARAREETARERWSAVRRRRPADRRRRASHRQRPR